MNAVSQRHKLAGAAQRTRRSAPMCVPQTVVACPCGVAAAATAQLVPNHRPAGSGPTAAGQRSGGRTIDELSSAPDQVAHSGRVPRLRDGRDLGMTKRYDPTMPVVA